MSLTFGGWALAAHPPGMNGLDEGLGRWNAGKSSLGTDRKSRGVLSLLLEHTLSYNTLPRSAEHAYSAGHRYQIGAG